MVQDNWSEIERAAENGDTSRLIDLCLTLDEAAKRRLSNQAVALARRLDTTQADWIVEGNSMRMDERRSAQAHAASAAAFCVGPPPTTRSRAWVPEDRLEAVVRSRPRDWRDRWALRVVQSEWDAAGWRLLRTLVREGECDKPDGVEYIRAMVRHADWLGPTGYTNRDLHAALLKDPELLEEDVWRIFELEEKVLSAGWFEWDTTLIQLSSEGVISRYRLIDECLGALRRDFAPGVAQSFTAFHDQLAPSVDEISRRIDEYLRLLGSPVESTVGFALRHLTQAERAGALDARALIEHLAPAVTVRPKGHAKRAVALLGTAIKSEPALVSEALELALDALSHQAAEVQDAALKLIQKNVDGMRPDQRVRLAELVRLLDPSIRPRAAVLVDAEGVQSAAGSPPAVAVPMARPLEPDAIPRLRDDAALLPVTQVDELLALTSVVLERPDDPNELERFVDGVARLCDQAVPDARRAALLRRVDGEFARWSRGGTLTDAKTAVAVVTHHWLRRAAPDFSFSEARGPRAALGRRLSPLCHRVARGRARGLLSAPTHLGGFIDPVILVVRLEAAPDVEDYDVAQAVLRIAPDRRPEALARIDGLQGEGASVVRAALGGEARRPRFRARLPASWDAVDALAAPGSVLLEARPHDEQPPWRSPQPKVKIAPPMSPARLLGQYESIWGLSVDIGMQRWLALIWPAQRELYYGTALRVFTAGSIWLSAAERETLGAALEPLLEPDEVLGPNAHRLIAAALGSSDNDRLLAADVVVEAIRSRRLLADELGSAIADAMRRERAVADRWGASLESLADYGPLHAYELQRVLESTLGCLGDAQPRMTKFLDLLRRVAQDADARIVNLEARAWLERVSPRSKSGQLAQAALSVTGDGGARSLEAAAAASEAERDRELRWSAARH